ncbi:MAG: TetR/AcrR family transcriptional regulator [Schwartzia sp.]|nr:TetR/AcrR family transcriptional regulator [Schwartzia sp. (in: firmicutes)]
MRNENKDVVEMAARREKMLKEGFRLFSEKRIEPVSMQSVADASKLGIATVYRYFHTKTAFVLAIATRQWKDYYGEVEKMYRARGGDAMTAAEELEFFLDCFIDLYKNHKGILRFNRNFDVYIRQEGISAEDMRPYNEAVEKFAQKFHTVYQKAKKDGTLKLDLPERKFFVSSLYIMLSVAGKYAEGLVYPPEMAEEEDLTDDLVRLKNMILSTYKA